MIYLYRSLYFIFGPFYILVSLFSSKKRGQLFAKESTLKKNHEKTYWFHCASGEFEHAKPLIRKIKEDEPWAQIVVTYSSSSYLYAIKSFKEVDQYHPYPLEFKIKIEELITKINPKIVLFARTDVWPELAHQLKKRKIKSLLFARTEKKKIPALKKLSYALTYNKLDHISFSYEQDRKNFTKQITHPSTSVEGDPRVDEVFIKQAQQPKDEHLEHSKNLILASVWPEDLDILLEASLDLVAENKINRLIIAPHKPEKKIINSIKAQCKKTLSKNSCLLSSDFQNPFDFFQFSEQDKVRSKVPFFKNKILIVDQLGILFDLYSCSQLAFVGGSFKKKVHSVLEPLSYGIPVLVGPNYKNNAEARHFSQAPQNFVRVLKSAEDFKRSCEILLRKEQKKEILSRISLLKGATQRVYGLIHNLNR